MEIGCKKLQAYGLRGWQGEGGWSRQVEAGARFGIGWPLENVFAVPG